MLEVMTDDLENKLNLLFKEVVAKQKTAIKFLSNPTIVKNYLNSYTLDQQFEGINIIDLRIDIPWFDCSLKILEGVELLFNEYSDKIFQQAKKKIELYYFSSLKREKEQSIKNKVLQQTGKLIKLFLQQAVNGQIIAQFPGTAEATMAYEEGLLYQIIHLPIPYYSPAGKICKAELQCMFSFYWNDEHIWGELDISSGKLEKAFSREDLFQFLRLVYIDLEANGKILKRDLKIDEFGEFSISENQEIIKKIQQYLGYHELVCVLKIRY